jgi:AMP-polyphosphate phosphotransferase
MGKQNDTGKRVLKLQDLDLSKKMEDDEYQQKLAQLQVELVRVQRRVIDTRQRIVLAFEGLDAAGKGGVIRRLTTNFDPRGFDVHPVGAPNEMEKQHHYLRRFWQRLPSRGRIAIFDRTWYGRLLVEPIEGFCTHDEYARAPQEIREFERVLADDGYCLLKFWIYVDKEEQLKRFKSRETDPLKSWKLTAEDWRNRDKFDTYVEYANRAFAETDAPHAPWYLIPGNSKNFARIKVVRIVVDTLDKLG